MITIRPSTPVPAVATGLTQKANDVEQLTPMVDEAMAITEQQPEKVLADAG